MTPHSSDDVLGLYVLYRVPPTVLGSRCDRVRVASTSRGVRSRRTDANT